MSKHPSDWSMVNLGEITEIKASNIDKKISADQKSTLVCNYADVVTNSRITRGVNFLRSSATPAQIKTFSLSRHDILLTKDAEVGRVSIVEDQIRDLVCGYHLYQLRTSTDEVLPEYLFYALQSFGVQSYFKKERTGTTIAGLARSPLDATRIPIPPLPEQKKIAEILSEVDNLISKLLDRTQKYQNLLIAIQENELQVLKKEHIKQVELNSQNIISLGELFEFRNGLNYSKLNSGQGLKVLGVADFKDNLIPIYDSLNEISPSKIDYKKSLLKEGDLVFVRSNGNRDLIGRCLSIENIPNQEISHSGFTIRARLKDMQKNNILFLKSILQSPAFRRSVSSMGGGTNISNLSQEMLSDTLVVIPDLDKQEVVSKKIISLQNMIKKSENQLVRIKNLKQALSQDLLSGCKRVNV